MFSGKHAALAQYNDVVVLSVGYRRTRMPKWIFFGLYPVFKMMDFAFKMMNFVLKMMDFVVK